VSTPAPDPEKRADRRLQFGLGLIAAFVGLLGVGLGTYLANDAQKETVASQSEQASQQYIRDQRRQAYGDLLRANRKLLGLEQDLLLYEPVPQPRATELQTQASEARRQYYGSVDIVKVVGPKTLLTKIYETLSRAHNAAARVIARQVAHPRQTPDENEKVKAAVLRAWDATDQIVLDFLKVLDAEK
jgi:hypothetical protein